MAKSVALTLIRQESAICGAGAFRGDNDAVSVALHALVDFAQELFLIEGDFREQNNMWRVAALVRSQRAGACDPASVSTHHLENEDFG